jgi:hypothetical protein
LKVYLAEWTGLEPATSCVTGRHSNQLNYHSSRLGLQIYTYLVFTQIKLEKNISALSITFITL